MLTLTLTLSASYTHLHGGARLYLPPLLIIMDGLGTRLGIYMWP